MTGAELRKIEERMAADTAMDSWSDEDDVHLATVARQDIPALCAEVRRLAGVVRNLAAVADAKAARLLAGVHLLRNLAYAGSTPEYIAQVGQWVIDGHHGEDEDPPKDESRSSDTPAAPSAAAPPVGSDEQRYENHASTGAAYDLATMVGTPRPAPSSEYRSGYKRAVEDAAEAAVTVNCPGPHGEGYCVALPSVMDALRSRRADPERDGTQVGVGKAEYERANAAESDLAASIAREGEQGQALIALKCELVCVKGVLRMVLSEIGMRDERAAYPYVLSDDLRAEAEEACK